MRLKNTIPSSRAKWFGSAWPITREPWATSTSPSSTGRDEPRHLLGQVLAVGVERHDDDRARVGHQPVAGPQRGAAAAVDHVARDGRAVGAGDVARAVARAVVDDQHGGLDAADASPGSAAAPGRCCPPRCRRGSRPRPGPGSARAARLAELLPRDPLEHAPTARGRRAPSATCCAASAGTARRSRTRRGRGSARRRPCGTRTQPSIVSVSVVAETTASASAEKQQDQDVDVAQRAAAPDREPRSADARDQAGDPDCGELHRVYTRSGSRAVAQRASRSPRACGARRPSRRRSARATRPRSRRARTRAASAARCGAGPRAAARRAR